MYGRPDFALQTVKAIIKHVESNLGLVHENPDQAIQGGAPGEHFHLTENEHTFLQELFANGVAQKIYEPMMANDEFVYIEVDGQLDVVTAWGGDYAS